jgi:protein SCO1/2
MTMNKSSIAIVALLALAGGFLGSWYLHINKPVSLEAGTWFGEQARALPDFKLIDHNNQPLAKPRLRGNWSLMFFGYTHCPDICPTSLQTLGDMIRAIDDSDVRDAIEVYFVSVDPDRDSPEVLSSYVTYFNPEFTGATADMAEIRILTSSLGIRHEIHKQTDDDLNYGVDHSGAIILINPSAEFAGMFGPPHNAQAMAHDMSLIIEHSNFPSL